MYAGRWGMRLEKEEGLGAAAGDDDYGDEGYQDDERREEGGVYQSGGESPFDTLPPGDIKPLTVVYDQQHSHQGSSYGGLPAQGEHKRKDHEETELAQYVGRGRRYCRRL